MNGATILAFPGVLVAPVAPALRRDPLPKEVDSTPALHTTRTAALAITARIAPLHTVAVKPDVINTLTRLLERAKNGGVIGLIVVAAIMGDDDETSISGEFQEDPGYARAAAQEGFDLLLGDWSPRIYERREQVIGERLKAVT